MRRSAVRFRAPAPDDHSVTLEGGDAMTVLSTCRDMQRPRELSTVSRMEALGDDRVTAFQRLHSSGCFVMPNPWDVGSARALEQLGFKALATTSAGFAWTLGRADNQVTLARALDHLSVVAGAVKVPVSADFEGGFAVDPQQVHANVMLAAATGIAGLSIEDSTRDQA